MNATEKYAAAVASADTNFERIAAKAAAAYEAAAQSASDELAAAVARYDEAVAAAEAKRSTDRAAETGRRRALVAEAEAEFDTAMREKYGAAPDVAVVVTSAGSLELRDGRRRLGGAVDQGHAFRVDGPTGSAFVPTAAAAREALWSVLADEQPEGLRAHLRSPAVV